MAAPAGILYQLNVAQSKPNRDAYIIIGIQGCVRLIGSAERDVRVGDTVTLDEIETFITNNPKVLVITS